MKQIYNYDNNSILFIRKSGHTFDLKLRKGITIIDGASATGKTLLFNDIKALKDLNPQTTGYDVSNIELITRNSDIIDDNKVLYIIDKAEHILNDEMCKSITKCKYARFLIFTRLAYNLYVSPNHFGEFENSDNIIRIKYAFDEKGWY